ncbi:MAG TPA: translation elongation factor Ts [Acidimicrobiales bacterium]|jgi:elongation factor Ts|nr:translation elongation factor Ts [Acidimicrobiales bacterium]
MAEFGAKDVKALRDATGAGMMDAKRALETNDGDFEASAKWLREQGIVKSASRADRDNTQGAVAVASKGQTAAMVELKCETDFVAKSDGFTAVVNQLADAVLADGEAAVEKYKDQVDDLKVTLKENIEVGNVVRVEASADDVLDTYLHRQDGRGVNAVIIELAGGNAELAHDIAVHAAFTKPKYVARDEVPQEAVATEREALEAITRNEGKPEAALPKIVEGKLDGWFRESVLLEQKFVRDEKQTIKQILGDAKIVRFAQIIIGG